MDISRSFGQVCRVLFGRELGEIGRYEKYLLEMVDPPSPATSRISGKPVYLSRPYYCRQAKFVDADEAERDGEKVRLDDIKDIDSLFSAIGERFAYCGNKNLGVSLSVKESDMCNDSSDIFHSQNVIASRQVAYCNGVRESECAFGCMLGGEVGFSMRSQVFFYSKRCFETYLSDHCNDAYFCFNCHGCSDVMFSFNQHSRRNAIGNLEMPREKYLSLKKKLLDEIASGLQSKGNYPSLFELAGGGAHA